MARPASSTSLTGKLLFWVTVITAATLIAVVLASTNVARGVIQREIQRRAESAAEDVALEIVSSAEPLELLDSPMWANKLMRRLQLRGDHTGFEIEVVTRGRTGRLSATATDVQREPHRGDPPFDRVQTSREQQVGRHCRRRPRRWRGSGFSISPAWGRLRAARGFSPTMARRSSSCLRRRSTVRSRSSLRSTATAQGAGSNGRSSISRRQKAVRHFCVSLPAPMS